MIKKLIEKLKTLCFVMFGFKDEYVQYGMCPGFTVWINRGFISGHMIVKKSDSKEVISQRLTDLVTKICKENNLSDEQTVKHINDNLKRNELV